jgi:hypothetical protein
MTTQTAVEDADAPIKPELEQLWARLGAVTGARPRQLEERLEAGDDLGLDVLHRLADQIGCA